MAMLKITINPVWLEEETDLSRCAVCDDVVYYKMYRLWIMVQRCSLGNKTDIVVCESCNDCLKQLTKKNCRTNGKP